MKTKKISNTIYQVESESIRDYWYRIDIQEMNCNCSDFKWKGRRFPGYKCKHIQQVLNVTNSLDGTNIIKYMEGKGGVVDTIELMEKFGDKALDLTVIRGEILEQGGYCMLLDK